MLLLEGSKIESYFEKIKWHVKMHEKNAIRLDKKRSDIFPPLGVPLCILPLQNNAFRREAKSKETLKKCNAA